MAATTIIPLHAGEGGGTFAALARSVKYVENPDKTVGGTLVRAYECDPLTVAEEFMFSKHQYAVMTGRGYGKNDVIAYHLRQSFRPGEVEPAVANQIGYALAMKLTHGKHAFVCSTHVDKQHVHTHVIINSTSLDCTRKFRNFKGSSFVVRRISDQLCLENGLSIIEKPKRSRGKKYSKWLDGKKASTQPVKQSAPGPERPKLLIDIETKIRQGYGAGFQQYAKIQNLKEAAKTLIFLKENGVNSYDELVKTASDTSAEYSAKNERRKEIDARLSAITELQKQIGTYGKTREVYAKYKASKYSRDFYNIHAADIILHKAAKKYFDGLGLTKLPSINALKQEYVALLMERKSLGDIKAARENMIDWSRAKHNIDVILGELSAPRIARDRETR